MYTQTAHDEDAGVEYLRMKFDLVADIKSTDEVTFELGFLSSYDPWTNKQAMAEDGVKCVMSQNTQDTTFWSQTVTDHYYTCSTPSDCLYLAGTDDVYTANTDTGTGASDWTVPLEDDDADSPYCTANTDTTNFACSRI